MSAGMLGTEDPPAIRACEALIADAIERGASDIHLEPRYRGGLARLRIDGLLHDGTEFEPILFDRIVTRIKLLGGIDIAERRRPQDGRFSAGAFDVRVATMPLLEGERVTARLQANDARLPSIEALGFDPAMLARFRALVRSPQGLLIACGPTGSGKTTTIYSALAERIGATESLCSIEDPVEIRTPGINQVQVHEKAGLTFESAMRGLLRHDPDIVFVGEIRDSETAELAASAALCGRLVVSTLHAADAWTARMRMLDLGLAERLIDGAVTAYLSQRLLRRVQCDGGYSGRVGIFELAAPTALVGRSLSDPFHPLRVDAERHIREGRTTKEEVERVLGASY
ncbi:MAG: GspE/PulE family protein [Candidatus Baltobacteraceae bacterium]